MGAQKRNLTNDWNRNRRDFSIRTNEARKYRRIRRQAMIALGVGTVVVWLVMLLIKIFVFGISWNSLFDDILANILGILPPIIIFNFAYEYITRDSVSEETSAKIAEVLMSDADTIALFDEEPKKQFLMATLNSLVENKQEADMIYGVMEPYIERVYDIRKDFEYEISLREYREGEMYSPDKYYKIKESLHYHKIFMGDGHAPSRLHVGFMADLADLDEQLRLQEYIFRENLCMEQQDLDALEAMPEAELLKWITDNMHLRVMINNEQCSIVGAIMRKRCLDIELDIVGQDVQSGKEFDFNIEFAMPRVKDKVDFLVSISEPTYNPYIKFDYPEDLLNVEMFPFMNDGSESLVKNAQNELGECKIRMRNKWVYPISGVVFVVQEKKS